MIITVRRLVVVASAAHLLLLGACAPAVEEALPARLPAYASLELWSSDSVVRTPIEGGAPWHPDDDVLRESLVAAEHIVVMIDQFAAPVYFPSSATAPETVALTCGETWELGVGALDGARIPTYATPASDVDGDIEPVGCGEESDRDNFMVVLDLERRCELDFWQMRGAPGEWTASWASALSLDGEPVQPHGVSSRASGFAFAAGLVWPDEIDDGYIDHALVFSYPFTRSGGPVAPATDSDGITDEAWAIPIGARVQLDPALDLSALGLDGASLVIAAALQEYGMFLVDTGGESGIGLYGVGRKSAVEDPWAGIFPDEDFVLLDDIPLDALHVLEHAPQNAAFADELALPENDCADYLPL